MAKHPFTLKPGGIVIVYAYYLTTVQNNHIVRKCVPLHGTFIFIST